jgi:DNA-binding transcriptional regulator YhcF (GntR family)
MSGADGSAGSGIAGADVPGRALGIVITLESDSAVAPFEQLRTRIRDAVESGELAAGARLPTVRALATDLGIAANTVARSYRELEADGLIETRGRNGSFVAATGSPAHQEAQRAARAYADHISSLGVAPAEALALAAAALGLAPAPPSVSALPTPRERRD